MVQMRTRRVVRGGDASRYPELVVDSRSQAKVARVSGDLRLVPFKARKRLGSEMSPKQRRLQIKFEREEAVRRRAALRAQLHALLAKSPSASQLSIPSNVVGHVSPKALRVLGDELLTELSLRQVPPGARVTPKVLKFFGPEPSLMPRKARFLVVGGDEETIRRSAGPATKRVRRSSLELWIDSLFAAGGGGQHNVAPATVSAAA